MQVGKNDVVVQHESHLLLCWSERQSALPQLQDVELVTRDVNYCVVLSPVGICDETQIYIKSEFYTGNGIVKYCRPEGSHFMLTLSASPDGGSVNLRQEFDPGLLNVDKFLTEEEENKILDSLMDESSYSGSVQRIIHIVCLPMAYVLRWIVRCPSALFVSSAATI